MIAAPAAGAADRHAPGRGVRAALGRCALESGVHRRGQNGTAADGCTRRALPHAAAGWPDKIRRIPALAAAARHAAGRPAHQKGAGCICRVHIRHERRPCRTAHHPAAHGTADAPRRHNRGALPHAAAPLCQAKDKYSPPAEVKYASPETLTFIGCQQASALSPVLEHYRPSRMSTVIRCDFLYH